ENNVIAKNLKDLEKEYITSGERENYKFLKQYLTLHRAELFFADKAIFIEGDTERILLPAIMKKIDQEHKENPLLSQNISIVEVGSYSHIFEKFIEFIGIRSLVITDIDSAKAIKEKDDDGVEKDKIKKCPVSDTEASLTTNAALKFFHGDKDDLNYYITLKPDYKILRKRRKPEKNWVSNRKGKLLLVYQVEETNSDGEAYHARSFEDAFFHLNRAILNQTDASFDSLTQKYLKKFLKKEIDVYEFCEDAIGSKPSLAMEILLNSKSNKVTGEQFANWQIPTYIKDGMIWLKKN
ncbi:MAG TPA: ATP-dependent endonuclease, partial [Puia sp.]|nr:ATP-dependent endonuclease [Puia sp.]